MTDLATHALAFVAGAVPVWLVMRGNVRRALDRDALWETQAGRWQALHDKLVLKSLSQQATIDDLRTKHTPHRAPNGRFVKKEGK